MVKCLVWSGRSWLAAGERPRLSDDEVSPSECEGRWRSMRRSSCEIRYVLNSHDPIGVDMRVRSDVATVRMYGGMWSTRRGPSLKWESVLSLETCNMWSK